MKLKSTAWMLAALMGGTAIAGVAVRPSIEGQIVLETAVPRTFDEWTVVKDEAAQIIDPATKKLLDDIYDETLSRTYVSKDGYRIMLSMARTADPRGVRQAHRPEICYPAQGFKLGKVEDGTLATPYGPIEVTRLTTSMGARSEPVTYWLMLGEHVSKGNFDRRLIEIYLGMLGKIPGSLLFRVSSIDKDSERAFAIEQKFVADMMASVPSDARRKLSGLTPADATLKVGVRN
jgi:EpsI family protein